MAARRARPPPHTPRPYCNPELLTPDELNAYLAAMRADLERRAAAADAHVRGKVLGLGRRISRIPDPVNEADTWQYVDECLKTWHLDTLETAVGPVCVAFWSFPCVWTTDAGAIAGTDYILSRKSKGKRKEDYNKKNADDPVVLPSARPITNSKGMQKRLRAFLKFHRKNCRAFTLAFDDPRKKATITNDRDWADANWLRGLQRTENRELRAFESMHFLPITEADVRNARCSWVKRILGVPVLLRPDGRFTLLGRYYREIENHAFHRRKQRPNDPDPVLFPATKYYWLDRDRPEKPMTNTQQRTRLGRVYNLKKISPESLLRLGLANAIADKAPTDYLVQSLGLIDPSSIQRLEAFQRRVLFAIKTGTAKGLGDPRNGQAAPGKAFCFSCGTEQDISRSMCIMEDCNGELKAHVTKKDRAKWLLHRALDVLIKNTRPEDEEDRWTLYTQIHGGEPRADA